MSTAAVTRRAASTAVLTPLRLGAALALALVAVMVVNLAAGALPIPVTDLPRLFAGLAGWTALDPADRTSALVLGAIRGPRILLGVAVGAVLGIAGAAMQGLFRNPLAEPGLVGVSSGAALFAAMYIVIGATFLGPMGRTAAIAGLPLAAFAGALGAAAIVMTVRRIDPAGGVVVLLLAGIAVNALAGAGIGLLTHVSDDQQLRTLTFWTLGSLSATIPIVLIPAIILMVAAGAGLLAFARPLDMLALGDEAASHAGVPVRRVERGVTLLVAVAVGAAVSVSGLIGFVGLVVPHLVRLAVGPQNSRVLPLSALAGALLLSSADLVARIAVAPAELPLGVVTALVGAPVFLWLLSGMQQRGVP